MAPKTAEAACGGAQPGPAALDVMECKVNERRRSLTLSKVGMSLAIFVPTTRCHQLSHTGLSVGIPDEGARKLRRMGREEETVVLLRV